MLKVFRIQIKAFKTPQERELGLLKEEILTWWLILKNKRLSHHVVTEQEDLEQSEHLELGSQMEFNKGD